LPCKFGGAGELARKGTMKTCKLAQTDLTVSRIAYGFGMLAGWDKSPLSAATIDRAEHVIKTAYDHGITLFDHADVDGFGRAEEAFGEVLRRSPGLRDSIVVQTKCGECLPGDPYALLNAAADSRAQRRGFD
jgi:predicted oxidoreductase